MDVRSVPLTPASSTLDLPYQHSSFRRIEKARSTNNKPIARRHQVCEYKANKGIETMFLRACQRLQQGYSTTKEGVRQEALAADEGHYKPLDKPKLPLGQLVTKLEIIKRYNKGTPFEG